MSHDPGISRRGRGVLHSAIVAGSAGCHAYSGDTRMTTTLEEPMKSDQLKAWRLAHNLTQAQAAAALGIAYATYKFYEAGKRSGHPVTIPRPIELATRAISLN